jgi:hypothetical protein
MSGGRSIYRMSAMNRPNCSVQLSATAGVATSAQTIVNRESGVAPGWGSSPPPAAVC